jgi:3-hydroxyacyl-[acyl-carrier-protein] dehydratase
LKRTKISLLTNPSLMGHFPGMPVFPGVLLLEAMAQAAGILGFVTMDKTPADGSIYYFVGADNLRFKRPCVPGDQVMLFATVLSERRGIWKFEVESQVDGELAACRYHPVCEPVKRDSRHRHYRSQRSSP